jgi:thioredoxin
MVKVIESLADIPEKGKVVLDCFATWCGPCKRIAPIYEKLQNEFPRITFLKADTDQAEDIAASLEVSALPTFVFLVDGKAVGRIEGADVDGIINALKRLDAL